MTLLEVLIAIAIVGLLIALLLPAVQYSRESARRMVCSSNLRQIMIAALNFEAANGTLPPGADRHGLSAHVSILPYFEQPALANLADQLVAKSSAPGVIIPKVQMSRDFSGYGVPLFVCPSDPEATRLVLDVSGTNYGANSGSGVTKYGFNGAFQHIEDSFTDIPEGLLSLGDFRDGTSSTAAFSEILVGDGMTNRPARTVFFTRQYYLDPSEYDDLCRACLEGDYQNPNPTTGPVGNNLSKGRPWTWGDSGRTWYNHALSPGSPSCHNQNDSQRGVYSASSEHTEGINSAYADGHVSFISNNIDVEVWRALGSRNGQEAGM